MRGEILPDTEEAEDSLTPGVVTLGRGLGDDWEEGGEHGLDWSRGGQVWSVSDADNTLTDDAQT